MNNIAVFASGRGSNFSAIIKAAKKGKIKKMKIDLAYCGGIIFNGNVNDNWEKINYAVNN